MIRGLLNSLLRKRASRHEEKCPNTQLPDQNIDASQHTDEASNAASFRQQALTHLENDDIASAIEVLRTGRDRYPEDVAMCMQLANVLIQHGLSLEAIECMERALLHGSQDPELWRLLCETYSQTGGDEEAQYCFDEATLRHPEVAQLHAAYGNFLKQHGALAAASDAYIEAVRLAPNNTDFLVDASALELDACKYSSARSYCQRALESMPTHVPAMSNLGLCYLLENQDTRTAHRWLDQALAIEPLNLNAQVNLGLCLVLEGNLEQALRHFETLYDQWPDDSEIRLHLAICHLSLGHYASGWRYYEARKHMPGYQATAYEASPAWQGESVSGKRLLALAEQGLGDEIMFSSCLPDLLTLNPGHVTLECDPRLLPLFRRSFPEISVCEKQAESAPGDCIQAHAPYDFYASLGDLPQHFRNRSEAFPLHKGYLKADALATTRWQERLNKLGAGLNIGISWRGGTARSYRYMRSLSLARFMKIFTAHPSVQVISLQYGDCSDEIDAYNNTGVPAIIHHWTEAVDDYDQTAALVNALDLVISVQTALVHLTGAVGKPAWVLVPHSAEWRYGMRCEQMAWYPNVRLFRQPKPGSWRHVIDRLRQELTVLSVNK